MRTLTSVQSADFINALVRVDITPTDQSTTYIFEHTDIVEISGLSWECPFTGGLGKSSNYNLTLSSSLGFIKGVIDNLPKAEVVLRVDLNQDTIQPHVGRVQSIVRNGADPNLLSMRIYDRLLDANPSFPLDAIVDSYSAVHPEVILADFGYPSYYGKHTRPFFHTPVDCSISLLLGPQNVSSHNHVNSVFYNSDITQGFSYIPSSGINQATHLPLMNFLWEQQSVSTNEIHGSAIHQNSDNIPFEIRDHSFGRTRTFTHNDKTKDSSGTILVFSEGQVFLGAEGS